MTNQIIAFIARQAVVDIHYHKCFQIVISLLTPFDSVIDGVAYPMLKGFLVNQGVTHSCKAQETVVLVCFIDAESAQGKQMKHILHEKPFLNINAVLPAPELEALPNRFIREEPGKLCEDLIRKILPATEAGQNMDERIETTFAYIDAHLDDPLVLEDLSRSIFLSPERLRHLFAEQTGIPFSQYVLWQRIKRVLFLVVKEHQRMADAAIQNGFTDQAHFARLFKRTFGVSATQLLKNSRFVQFLAPEL